MVVPTHPAGRLPRHLPLLAKRQHSGRPRCSRSVARRQGASSGRVQAWPAQPTTEATGAPSAAAQRQQTASTSGQEQPEPQPLMTLEEVQQAAAVRGFRVRITTLGPVFRVTVRQGPEDEKGEVAAVVNGFVAPWLGFMHVDTLQIFARGAGGPLGVGLLIGAATFLHGHTNGCTRAEILAINDDDTWHARLVRYYAFFGFEPVLYVGNRGFFADLPHMLVWGGEGLRMDANIEAMLRRWTPAVRSAVRRGRGGGPTPSSVAPV